jgi:predicted ATPase
MLDRLDIRTFKCFRSLSLGLSQLTLLSGANGSGKSTALQGLVLLQQTMLDHEWSSRLILNGTALKLGTVTDVVDETHGRRDFEIGLSGFGAECHWRFEEEDRSALSMAVAKVVVNGTSNALPAQLQFLLPTDVDSSAKQLAETVRGLTYLMAERMGPRDTYPLEDMQVSRMVGPTGENTVSLLYQAGHEPVLEALRLDGIPPTRLHHVTAWMRQFFPGSSLAVQLLPQTNALTLGLRTSDESEFHRPIHVGFGFTQVLPIIVAAMFASEGDVLVIENPEVHLHPRGQALMGEFLAKVAAAGVQVIIETHSDHVLNGVRRSVKAGLPPQDVTLYFFRMRDGEAAQIETPQLDASGNIDYWPEGFFDQFDKDMNHFAGWGK